MEGSGGGLQREVKAKQEIMHALINYNCIEC